MFKVESVGLPHHLSAPAVLTLNHALQLLSSFLYSFPWTIAPIKWDPLTPLAIPSFWDLASLTVSLSKLWLLGVCFLLPNTPRPPRFCLSLPWTLSPIPISYRWTLPVLQSAVGLLPLPRSFFLIFGGKISFFASTHPKLPIHPTSSPLPSSLATTSLLSTSVICFCL